MSGSARRHGAGADRSLRCWAELAMNVVKAITKAGQLVFRAVGDSGSCQGPENISLLAVKMAADFDDEAPENVPHFFFRLGDEILNFGETQYCYAQFSALPRYPAPIIAVAGNPGGTVSLPARIRSLSQRSATTSARPTPKPPRGRRPVASRLVQPWRVLHCRSGPCCGSSPAFHRARGPWRHRVQELGSSQLAYLTAALTRANKFSGVADRSPP